MTDEPLNQPENPAPPAPQFVTPSGQLQYGQSPYFAYPTPLPSNNLAVASMITSASSLGLLLVSLGLFAPICAIASAIGSYLGHKGKVAVDEGRAVQQRDLAVAGFWVGTAGWILSLVAIAAWIILIVVLASLDWTNNDATNSFEVT